MKKIINKYRARLTFPKYDFSIGPNEIKEITDEQFYGVIMHESIEEVLTETSKKEKFIKEVIKVEKTVEKVRPTIKTNKVEKEKITKN